MIILAIETLIIFICVMIFSTLIIDEKKKHRRELRAIKLMGFWEKGDRRSEERLNVILEVKYSVGRNTAISKTSKTKDISTKGIKLLLDEKIEKTTLLQLEIKVPDQNRLIRGTGEVVWTEEAIEDEKNSAKRLFNTGIKISNFQEADEKRFFDFVYSLERQKR